MPEWVIESRTEVGGSSDDDTGRVGPDVPAVVVVTDRTRSDHDYGVVREVFACLGVRIALILERKSGSGLVNRDRLLGACSNVGEKLLALLFQIAVVKIKYV